MPDPKGIKAFLNEKSFGFTEYFLEFTETDYLTELNSFGCGLS